MVQTVTWLGHIRRVLLVLIFFAGMLLLVDALTLLVGRPGFLNAFSNVSVLSAFGFVFGSLAISLLYRDVDLIPRATVGMILSLLVFGLGLVQITYFAWKAWEGQFDEANAHTLERLGLSTPIISFNLTLLGSSLLAAQSKRNWIRWVGQFFALVVVLLAFLALLTFLYRAQAVGLSSGRLTRSSLPSAMVTLFLGLFATLATREVGLSRLLFTDSIGGRLARRLIPVTVLIQVVFEYLRARNDLHLTYDEPITMQLVAISNSLLLLGGITYVAASLDRVEEGRREALQALTLLNNELEDRVTLRTRELEVANRDLTHEIQERRVLESEYAEVREQVAQRLGRVIHDHLSQDLIGLTFNLKALQQRLRPLGNALAQEVSDLEGQSRQLVEQVRTIARQVYPPELAVSGLMESLLELMRNKDGQHGLRCHFECEEPVSHPDPQVEAHLFYIAQEAVENAIRHGGGSSVWVRLTSTEDHLQVLVEDDGPGMPETKNGPGIGLRIMQSRARMVGGVLHLGPRDGGGTRLTCRVSLRPENIHLLKT